MLKQTDLFTHNDIIIKKKRDIYFGLETKRET